ncbi:hypothetical protein [Helicobacter bilis]|uniref:hypothetical protein n=1 Tax=Helicobacter bilis TaxID=37372 RepID=UPI000B31E916|nr:hypothetical protein [Helicobacter bilis]
MTAIEKRLQRKKNLIKINKILKKFTILFLIGIIYLIGMPLYVVFIIIPLVLFIRFKYNIGSVLVILFFLFIFYYTPYSYYLEPSYWQFRNMCKLNELPNNEEKYNKILRYFDTSLDTLDWEELNGKTWKISEDSGDYKKGVFEYATLSREKEINFRLGIIAAFYSNQSPITRHNTNVMAIDGTWHTRRYFPAGNEGSGFYWRGGDFIMC